MKLAGKKERIINCMFDMFFIFIIAIIVNLIVSYFIDYSEKGTYLITLLVFITYYICFEWISGRTPGKIISYTKVVMKNNKKLNFIHAFLRTIIRLTGMVPFTFLFGTDLGIHDIFANSGEIDHPRPV